MKAQLRVTGMTCKNCVRHVGEALRQVPGVTAAEVELATGTASVEHADDVDVTALCQAVADAGYEATGTLVT